MLDPNRFRESIMSTSRRLWIALITLLAASFSVLLWMGSEIARVEPPMPERVVTSSGQTLFTREDIEQGRIVWQSIGGQQMGTVWGHGALVAPDWSADWLHREALALLDLWARRDGSAGFGQLDEAAQAALQVRLRGQMRRNGFDAAPRRAASRAGGAVAAHARLARNAD
jgi:nitric oxide reductase subunit B